MTRDKLISEINGIVNYLTNGSVIIDDRVINGHPAFYIKHTKDEFDKELDFIIRDKELYDRFDLYYYMNYMFKYMLNEYDSHTRMYFTDSKALPIKIRIIDGIPYIVDTIPKYYQYKGSSITSINGIDINQIMSELEKIICYASNDYLRIMLEDSLSDCNVLKSLPIINVLSDISFTTDKGEINFEKEDINAYTDINAKPNYSLDIKEKTAVITYKSCKDEDKMIELVDKLKSIDQLDSFIVDLRGNSGGNSSINRYLVDYLNGKKVIVLCDERVFSSARMCMIDLKNNGAELIGTNPGTPISCFGNCMMKLRYEDLGLRINGSVTYWYYDENYNCSGIYRNEFDDVLRSNPDLLKPVFLSVDEIISPTIDDYLNNNDPVLNKALLMCSKTYK